MSTFIGELHKVVLGAIEKLEVYETHPAGFPWSGRFSRIITNLVLEEVISVEQLSQALHVRLLKFGRVCYMEHKGGQYPKHTTSPQAFAYALLHGEFTEKERASINFDRGETIEEFLKLYGTGVKDKIVKRLSGYRVIPPSLGSDDSTYEGCC